MGVGSLLTAVNTWVFVICDANQLCGNHVTTAHRLLEFWIQNPHWEGWKILFGWYRGAVTYLHFHIDRSDETRPHYVAWLTLWYVVVWLKRSVYAIIQRYNNVKDATKYNTLSWNAQNMANYYKVWSVEYSHEFVVHRCIVATSPYIASRGSYFDRYNQFV